jgi:hypothetical protein
MAPSGAELQALEGRRAELLDALAPGDEEAIKQAIRALKGGFPSYGADAVGAAYQTEFYFKALASFPVWAVHEACARFRDGRNSTPWNARECPSSAQVAQECRVIIEPVQDELTPLADVLDAEIAADPDADKAARAAAVLRWETDIRPQMAAKDKPTKPQETPEQILERLQVEATQPVTIGAGLSKLISGMKKGEAA